MTGVVPLHQPSLDRRERTRLGRGQVPRTAGKATTGRATQVTGRAAGPGIGQVQRTAGAHGRRLWPGDTSNGAAWPRRVGEEQPDRNTSWLHVRFG